MSTKRPAMNGCLQATRRISEALEHDLPPWQRLTLRLHLAICTDCRNFQKNSEALRRIMQHYAGADGTYFPSASANTPNDNDVPDRADIPDDTDIPNVADAPDANGADIPGGTNVPDGTVRGKSSGPDGQ